MKKTIMILAPVLLFLSLASVSHAQYTALASGGGYYMNYHGIYRYVVNYCGPAVFAPWNTYSEWNNFVTYKPACVAVSSQWCGDGSCNNGETCGSCAGDCGACCSGCDCYYYQGCWPSGCERVNVNWCCSDTYEGETPGGYVCP